MLDGPATRLLGVPADEVMLAIKFPQIIRLAPVLLVAALPMAAQGPKIYPAAMSMDYNPLGWQGDDAQFGLDMLHSSRCAAEVSKTVAAKTQDQAVQSLALTIAHEQSKIYRELRNMARTFDVHLPPRRELDNCPDNSRMAELSGREMDSNYLTLLRKSTAVEVSRFEAEVSRPRLPSNWSLWKLAQNDLVILRAEEAAVKSVEKAPSP